MANVVTHPHLQVDFHRSPVAHSPSFGFGLSSTPAMGGWPATHPHAPQLPWNIAANSQFHAQPTRAAKRRYEPEDEAEGRRDEEMDRSPTPERPKRAAPKRARTTPALAATSRGEKNSKENKPPSGNEESDVDVGVLLASLPPQSLLPLLMSLLAAQPSLKPTVLSLIPRPTLDTALQALAQAANKLRDAYPYSNSPFSQASPSTSFSFGSSGFSNNRSNTPPSSGFGFGYGRSAASPAFGSHSPSMHSTGMREEYILSRLRPHIAEFVSACFSYLPYFSYIAAPIDVNASSSKSQAQSHAAALQLQHKDRSHPTETYMLLSALTTHILSQPPLTQSSLAPLILPRLSEEWKAWVDRVDQVVNREGGMFGMETVRDWERGLDEFAQAKENGLEVFRQIRDHWVSKVGWLVGRQQAMQEL